jgi:hypothetical protein
MPERSNAAGLVHLDVLVIQRETEAAFKVMLEDRRTVWWLPKSAGLRRRRLCGRRPERHHVDPGVAVRG